MNDIYKEAFSKEILNYIFPQSRTEDFFDALLGDSRDGAYNIVLSYSGSSENQLQFEFRLERRNKGKCLKCSLTYGLPDVLERHPIIDIENMVKKICLNINVELKNWKLGNTYEIDEELHIIPMTIEFSTTK